MKRLYKSRKEKVIDGVCGGIAEYFDVDPLLVRIIFIALFFAGGSSILAYIIGMIIIPKAPLEQTVGTPVQADTFTDESPIISEEKPHKESNFNSSSPVALIIGLVLVFFGMIALMDNLHLFGGLFWWFRHHFWDYMIPAFIIVLGITMIMRGAKK